MNAVSVNSDDTKVHSKIGASSMPRFKECPGSVKLSEGQLPSTSAAASEGSFAHHIGEKALAFGELTAELGAQCTSDEMRAGVKLYVDLVISEMEKADVVGVEVPLSLEKIFPGAFGTSDAYAYYASEKLLRIYDFKFGKSPVYPEDNDQLLYYALGVWLGLPSHYHVHFIELVIVQPRAPRHGTVVFRWKFPALERILDFAADLYFYAKRTTEEIPLLKEGKWCFFCPAQPICPLLHAKRLEAAKLEFSPVVGEDSGDSFESLL